MKIYTTLNRIKAANPCSEGWKKLLSSLGKTKSDDDPIDLLTILESNGVSDCLWAFQCTDDNETVYRLIAADFAESVLHIYEEKYPGDDRPRKAIDAARDYANGIIDDAARASARAAAVAAARDAAVAAARDAAVAAAGAAVAAARDAAVAAARDAAGAAARDAAVAAAGAAAWAAAMDAAVAAAGAAAGAAARDAEQEKQRQILIKYLS